MVVIGYRRKSWNFSIAENPSLLIYLWDNTKVFLSFIFFVYIMLAIFLEVKIDLKLKGVKLKVDVFD
jgi:hypothetical protein